MFIHQHYRIITACINLKHLCKLSIRTAVGILTILCISSCTERNFNAFESTEYTFSVYGALNLNENPNYVRVKSLKSPLFSNDEAMQDITVTLTQIDTGESINLRDTTVTFQGNTTYNYVIDMDLLYDSAYKIVIEDPDGNQTTSIAHTPQKTSYSWHPMDSIQCETMIEFVFQNVRFPEFIQMNVAVDYDGAIHNADVEIVGRVRHRNESNEMYIKMRPRNLLVEIFPPIIPDNPHFNRFLLFPTVGCNRLDTPDFQITFRHFGPEWADINPGSGPSSGLDTPYSWPIDFETADIENGIGFFGAYYENSFTFSIQN